MRIQIWAALQLCPFRVSDSLLSRGAWTAQTAMQQLARRYPQRAASASVIIHHSCMSVVAVVSWLVMLRAVEVLMLLSAVLDQSPWTLEAPSICLSARCWGYQGLGVAMNFTMTIIRLQAAVL